MGWLWAWAQAENKGTTVECLPASLPGPLWASLEGRGQAQAPSLWGPFLLPSVSLAGPVLQLEFCNTVTPKVPETLPLCQSRRKKKCVCNLKRPKQY